MAKLTLSDIAAGYGAPATLNANNAAIETALENTLSRDGSDPNNMESDLDMDSNRIINLGSPVDSNDAARWIDVTDAVQLTGQAVPSLTGNANKYLTNDSSSLSWVYPYPRTDAESTAGVTPTDYKYPPGDVRRYGATVDGVADDRTALNSAYAAFKQGNPSPFWSGSCYVSQNGVTGYALQWDGDVVLSGYGQASIVGDGTNNYTLLYCNGSSKKIDIRGMTFDCKKNSPARAVDNSDICLRLQGTFTTVNVENCVFQNYDEDGIYVNSTISGVGGALHHNKFTNGARSAATIVKGQYLSFDHNEIQSILLSPIGIMPPDNTTVCRQISVDHNRIVGCGAANGAIDGVDRSAIYIGHKTGATGSVMGQYTCRGNVIKDFGSAYAGASYAFGVEIRELSDCIVSGNEVTGCKHAGLYSYLTTRAAFVGNLSTGNDKGLWMNKCTDYSDVGNVCYNNTTADRDYNGPDGATTYVQADGLTTILARASVSFSAGAPVINSSFNIASATDTGTGNTKFTFTNAAGNANYSVIAVFRAPSGTSGLIFSATHNTTDFHVVTLTAGVAADEAYDFVVIGTPKKTTDP